MSRLPARCSRPAISPARSDGGCLGAARQGGALLRDTDGFALTMVPLAQLKAVTEIAQVAVAALLALAALSSRRGYL